MQDMSEDHVLTLLFLINDPNPYKEIREFIDLSRLFSLFTEIDAPAESTKDKNKIE